MKKMFSDTAAKCLENGIDETSNYDIGNVITCNSCQREERRREGEKEGRRKEGRKEGEKEGRKEGEKEGVGSREESGEK